MKLKLIKITCNLFKKYKGPVHNKARLQLKTAKLKNSLKILKEINLKGGQSIRCQLKLSKRFIITDAYIGGHLDLSLFKLSCGYKRTLNRDNKQKFK